MTTRILFVCMGNICRSPLAEGLMRHHAAASDLRVEVDSAGTGFWHAGDPPDARAMVAARGHGLEISDLRARQIERADFTPGTLIIAMDRSTQDEIEIVRPFGDETPVHLMSRYIAEGPTDIPDPYYSGKFEPVIALLKQGIPVLIDALKAPKA